MNFVTTGKFIGLAVLLNGKYSHFCFVEGVGFCFGEQCKKKNRERQGFNFFF
jgi:hypothetical protein